MTKYAPSYQRWFLKRDELVSCVSLFQACAMPTRAQGKSRGYVALKALVSFSWGFSLKQKKPLVLFVGDMDQSSTVDQWRRRGCVSVGGDAQRPCPAVRSWELATIFYFLAGIFSLTGA